VGKYNKLFIFFTLLALPGLLFYLFSSTAKNNLKPLPIYGPRDLAQGSIDTIFHTIPDFKFINQRGDSVSNTDFLGNITVVDYFFARCPGICPKLSTQLQRVQDKYKKLKDFKILSFTVDPENDSVKVLADYARQYGANDSIWQFLTGNKKELYDIARNGYYLVASEGDGGPEDFIHSEKIVLIDKQGRIRGYYDGTRPGSVDTLITEIFVLYKE
jgi:protein SCO1/2